MNSNGLFWVVWRDGGGVPTVKHLTQIEAEKEAERLAKSLGGTFHVLQVVGSVTQAPAPPPPPPAWVRVQNRPENSARWIGCSGRWDCLCPVCVY